MLCTVYHIVRPDQVYFSQHSKYYLEILVYLPLVLYYLSRVVWYNQCIVFRMTEPEQNVTISLACCGRERLETAQKKD